MTKEINQTIGIDDQNKKIIYLEQLQIKGHSYNCAKHQIYEDGECTCGFVIAEEMQERNTVQRPWSTPSTHYHFPSPLGLRKVTRSYSKCSLCKTSTIGFHIEWGEGEYRQLHFCWLCVEKVLGEEGGT